MTDPVDRGAQDDDRPDDPIPSHETPGHAAAAVGGLSLSGFRDVFAIRDFRFLFWGQAVSALGDWVGTLAFIKAASDLAPDRPAAVAVVLVLRLLPSFFATPLGGVMSDRGDRKQIMIASDLARFAIIVAVPFVPKIGALYVFAFVSECFALVFLPARDASLPNIVPKERLEAANAMVMGSSFGGIPLAGAAFGILAWVGLHYPADLAGAHVFRARSYAFPFIFDGITFLVSAFLIAKMTTAFERTRETPGTMTDGSLFRAAREGARYITDRPFLRGLAAAVTVAMLGGGVLFALGNSYVEETLGGGSVEFGWLMALFGTGMVLGFFVSQIKMPGGPMWMVRIALLVMGAVLGTMAVFAWLFLAYIVSIVFGAAFSASLIVAMSTVQGRTDDRHRGRVMGAVHMLVRAALSFGALGAGAIATIVPDRGITLPFGFRPDKNQVALVVAGALIAAGAIGVRGADRDDTG